MKKQFSHRHSQSVVRMQLGIGVVLGISCLLLLFRLVVPNFFFAAMKPLWEVGTTFSLSSGNVASGFANNQKLSEKNSALVAENVQLRNENAVLTARAQDLTKLLGGDGTGVTGNELLAGVLARPPESAYDVLVVGKGTAEGVMTGAAVFGAGGIPIGTADEVMKHTTLVSLYSSAGRTTDAWVGSARLPLTLNGVGAGAFTASLQKASAVAVGDSVYLAGPGAIPMGTVSRIASNPSSPTVTLQIQPIINIFSITWVEIAR